MLADVQKSGSVTVRAIRSVFLVTLFVAGTVQAGIDVIPDQGVFINTPQTPLTPTPGSITLLATDNLGITTETVVTIDNASTLFAGSLFTTDGGASLLTLTGTGSRITLRRPDNSRGGILAGGTWQVLAGGVFDAADPASCTVAQACGMTIGQFRGTASSLLVSGTGSRFETIDVFAIAGNAEQVVFPVAGDIIATVTVDNGGRIISEDLIVGLGATPPNASGGFISSATLNVQGAGSLWETQSLATAVNTDTQAVLNLSNGGVMNVAGSSVLSRGNGTTALQVSGTGSRLTSGAMDVAAAGAATVNIATSGRVDVASMLRIGVSTSEALGSVDVNGAGSLLTVGDDLIIGQNFPGRGTLTVRGGADVRIGGGAPGNFIGTFLGLGLTRGNGTLLVDASTLRLEAPASSQIARLHAGDGGTGTVNLVNGAVVNIIKADVSTLGDGLIIGRNIAGNRGVGSITVDNSTLITASPRQTVDIGVNDDLGDFSANSDGTLSVLNQGLVRIDGQSGFASLRMGRGAGAVANLLVDNARLEVIGDTVNVLVGHDLFNATGNGQAALNLLNGATMQVRGGAASRTGVLVGSGSGNGSITVGANSVLDIAGLLSISAPTTRNDIQTGIVTINAGGTVNTVQTVVGNRGTLTGTGRLNAQLLRLLPGGTLTLASLDGVDELSLETGATIARTTLPFGRSNNQTLNVRGGTVLDVGNGLNLGSTTGTRATVNVSGAGSQLRTAAGLVLGSGGNLASSLRISQGAAALIEGQTSIAAGSTLTVAGATTLYRSLANMTVNGSVLLEDGGAVQAGSLSVVNGGLVGGTGTFTTTGPGGGVVIGAGGTLAPGNSPGTLNVNGNVTLAAGGRFLFEIGGTQAGQFDQLNVTGDIDLQGGTFELQLINGFVPSGSDSFDLITATGSTNISPGVAFVANGLGPDFEFTFRQVGNLSIGSLGFTAIDLQELENLSPNQTSMAVYMDDLCPRIEALVAPTANQADLDLICGNLRSGNNTADAVAAGLDALIPEEILGIVDTLLRFTTIQHGNLSQRLNGLRNGAARINVTGLDLITENIHIAASDLQSVAERIVGGAAGTDDFARWGFFSDGNFHYGDQSKGFHESGFDFETVNITMGVDYRLRDNLFMGVAGGYNEINADFDTGGGMLMKAGTLSVMGTWFKGESFYLDALATYGWAEADTSRLIQYADVGGKINRRATGSVDGTEFVATVGSGWDFTRGKWIAGPHAGANYSEIRLEELEERGARGASLKLREQVSRSFTANVGAHVSYTFTPSWGVFVPHARIDYVHEFQHAGQQENIRFAADVFQFDPFKPTTGAQIDTDAAEKSYWAWSVGAHAQFVRGFAAFVNYRGHAGLGNLDVSEVTVGLRYEKAF